MAWDVWRQVNVCLDRRTRGRARTEWKLNDAVACMRELPEGRFCGRETIIARRANRMIGLGQVPEQGA